MYALRAHIVSAAVLVGVAGLPHAVAAQGTAKLVAPVRGPAKVEITRPATKTSRTEMITTIMLKNMETAPIAGLKIEENWYDKAGNPIGGDVYRHKKPVQPGEVITIVLRTPRSASLSRNQCSFTHANGAIKQTVVPKIEGVQAAK